MTKSHGNCGKIVHRPCSSCISSIGNLTGTPSSSPCQLRLEVVLRHLSLSSYTDLVIGCCSLPSSLYKLCAALYCEWYIQESSGHFFRKLLSLEVLFLEAIAYQFD